MKKKIIFGLLCIIGIGTTLQSCTKSKIAPATQTEAGKTNKASETRNFWRWLKLILNPDYYMPDIFDDTFSIIIESTGSGSPGTNQSTIQVEQVIDRNNFIPGDDQTPDDILPENYYEAVYARTNNGQLRMLVDKQSMTQSTYDNLFGGGSIMIPAPFQLPQDVRDALGFPPGFMVAPGNYEVKALDDQTLEINFY